MQVKYFSSSAKSGVGLLLLRIWNFLQLVFFLLCLHWFLLLNVLLSTFLGLMLSGQRLCRD